MKKEEIWKDIEYAMRICQSHDAHGVVASLHCKFSVYAVEQESQLAKTENKLKDVYIKILEDIYYDYTCPEYGGVTELCRYCEEEKGHKHDPDCIVLEAENWLYTSNVQ